MKAGFQVMKTHFIDASGVEQKGTHQYPANSGYYVVILSNGRTSVEPYTVAFGWNNFAAWNVVLSQFIKPLF